MQLQLRYTNYTTPQLQLHYTTTTTTAALHYTTSSSCGWGDRPGDDCNHCNHPKKSNKHNSDHLSVHQWIRSAIRDSQQPTSPIGFLFLKLPPPPCAVLLVLDYPCVCKFEMPGHPKAWIWEITLQSPLFGQQRRDSLATLIGCMILGRAETSNNLYRDIYGILWIFAPNFNFALYLYILLWAPTAPHGLHPECLENRTGPSRNNLRWWPFSKPFDSNHSLQRCLILYMVHPFTNPTPT